MGFCNLSLKPGLLSISDCISDFKVGHKKEKKLIKFQDQSLKKSLRSFKITNYLFKIKLTLVPISPTTTTGRFDLTLCSKSNGAK